MIYLDNAATSWPKPLSVVEAMGNFLQHYGANPGRGGHELSRRAGQVVMETRAALARFINAPAAMHVVFTGNGTGALNQALKGFLRAGDHVITSTMEHNSVVRPLHVLAQQGVEVTKIPCQRDGSLLLETLEAALRPNTKLVALTHASNVSGTIMPITAVGKLTRAKGVALLVDAAQSIGYLPIDVQAQSIDLLAFPGHKGLLGPPGTGALYIGPGIDLEPLWEGGTGSHSESSTQPLSLPDRYESGTVNGAGIAGLGAGLRYIEEKGLAQLQAQAKALTQLLLEGLIGTPGVKVYGPPPEEERVPVLSFTVAGYDPGEVAAILDQVFNIACRSGLHCAPDAHRTLETFDLGGTIRFGVGPFNTKEDIEQALAAVAEISSRA